MLSTVSQIWMSMPAGVARDKFEALQNAKRARMVAGYEAQGRASKILTKFIMRCDHNSQKYFTIEAMSRLLLQDAPLSSLHELAKSRRFTRQNDLASI